ncbi:hypothetical protein CEXT_691851 [Caerostris extrusa]|uniref:Uncharacterized protein n=1 Tax=Caerostris extrusa TaxID=172846 RepID=A0AAV4VF63_CAEEX|nr:hypothetical protein CEXT_691851 [Caerostris extrusa]
MGKERQPVFRIHSAMEVPNIPNDARAHSRSEKHPLADDTETERKKEKKPLQGIHTRESRESQRLKARVFSFGPTKHPYLEGGLSLSLLFIALSARDPRECQPQNTSPLSPARGNHAGWVR